MEGTHVFPLKKTSPIQPLSTSKENHGQSLISIGSCTWGRVHGSVVEWAGKMDPISWRNIRGSIPGRPMIIWASQSGCDSNRWMSISPDLPDRGMGGLF